jgi:hypothetical protein
LRMPSQKLRKNTALPWKNNNNLNGNIPLKRTGPETGMQYISTSLSEVTNRPIARNI